MGRRLANWTRPDRLKGVAVPKVVTPTLLAGGNSDREACGDVGPWDVNSAHRFSNLAKVLEISHLWSSPVPRSLEAL
jgi:hypothetical protein